MQQVRNDNGYKYFLAYGLIILAVVLLAKTTLGYKLVYYFLALSAVVIVLGSYKNIQAIFSGVPNAA